MRRIFFPALFLVSAVLQTEKSYIEARRRSPRRACLREYRPKTGRDHGSACILENGCFLQGSVVSSPLLIDSYGAAFSFFSRAGMSMLYRPTLKTGDSAQSFSQDIAGIP
jgi:hypothetical protein